MSLTKCKECKKQISDKAESCPHCGAPGKGWKIVRKKWHERTSVTLCTAAATIIVVFGFIHIITNVNSPYGLPYDIVFKESFGFSETFINAKKILSLPYPEAKEKYPISCKALQDKEYMHPDELLVKRMNLLEKIITDEFHENMDAWQTEFEKTLNKPQQQWQDRLKPATESPGQKITDAEIDNNRAIEAAKNGQYETALFQFTWAIKKAPEYAEACFNRGLVYIAIGQSNQAISDFSQALAIKPDFIEAYIIRGNVHITLGNYEQAAFDFTKVIEAEPHNAEFLFRRSLAYYAGKDFDKATRDIHTVQNMGLPVPEGFLKALRDASSYSDI